MARRIATGMVHNTDTAREMASNRRRILISGSRFKSRAGHQPLYTGAQSQSPKPQRNTTDPLVPDDNFEQPVNIGRFRIPRGDKTRRRRAVQLLFADTETGRSQSVND